MEIDDPVSKNPEPNHPPQVAENESNDVAPSGDPKSTNATIHGDQERPHQSPPQPSSPKRKSSWVWNHFTRIKDCDPKKPRATCNYCGISYACHSKRNGTKNLLSHTPVCKKYPLNKKNLEEKGQSTLSFVPKNEARGSGPSLLAINFSVEACREALAEMVIIDELPFKFVENEGFRKFMRVAQPKLTIPSRTTVARDCLTIYKREKKNLKSALKGVKICITTNTWTSIQNINYMCLTAHYIDSQWNLHKKILNFCQVHSHKGEVLGKVVEDCLHGWEVDSIFTLTVDNASSNNGTIQYLKRRTKNHKGTILEHEYLHMRCCAHILNLIVGDGLREMDESIARVRKAMKYVKSSPSRLATFKNCIKKEKIESKSLLCLDVPTRWNSTYLMLEAAVKFELAFTRMEEDDDNYLSYFGGLGGEEDNNEEVGRGRGLGSRNLGVPKREDWEKAKTFVTFLKIFYNATLRFSGSLYVTSNAFFHDLVAIQSKLRKLKYHKDYFLSSMAQNMMTKFEKYWKVEKVNLLLYVAVVLDPRYKLKYLHFWFKELYDDCVASEMSKKVKDALLRLFDWYDGHVSLSESSQNVNQTLNQRGGGGDEEMDEFEFIKSHYKKHLEEEDNSVSKSEVERFLVETCEEDKSSFDILQWWKNNQDKYRILSLVARDILAIPVSTVASESAFSTGGRILDPFRSSLAPKTVEALVCSQNWLRSPTTPINIRDAMEEIEQYENIDTEILGSIVLED